MMAMLTRLQVGSMINPWMLKNLDLQGHLDTSQQCSPLRILQCRLTWTLILVHLATSHKLLFHPLHHRMLIQPPRSFHSFVHDYAL